MKNDKKNLLAYFKASTSKNWHDWQWQFRNRVTQLEPLENILGKAFINKKNYKAVTATYPMAITPYYLSLIKTDIYNDPIFTQCVPDFRELSFSKNAMEDPLKEDSHMPVPKLVHRYSDRCLAMVTETCATYCRHCNRKRFWSISNHFSLTKRLQKMTRYLAKSPQIREVIISGGDPLTFDDNTLEKILSSLKTIPHVEILRIGSRTPVVMPMRITKELCLKLKRYRPLWFNTQFNHPNEITTESARACQMLLEAGIPVSNQSVLLKGVNDSAEIMKRLLYGLQKISVRPYYLFHCDPVKGSTHFRTNPQSGVIMIETLRNQCSGLCLPQYVLDVPGSAGKIPLNIMSQTIKKDLKKHKHFFDKFK